MENWMHGIVDRQIHDRNISESEIEIYQYGYRLLFEKVVAFFLTICIAWLLNAWWEVFCFCLGFIPLRVYSGGFHAKKSVSCMLLSGLVLVSNIFLVRGFVSLNIDMHLYLVLLELPLFVLLYFFSPVETINRKIEESEKRFFRMMVCRIYFIEVLVEIFFVLCGLDGAVISFIVAHGFNVVTVLSGYVKQKISSRS